MSATPWRVRFACFLTLACAVPAARAGDYTWNAAASGNYGTSAAWSPAGGPPGAGDNALITTAGNYAVTLDDNRSVTNFTLNASGASLSHTSGTYTVGGSMTLQAGTYLLSGGTISGGTLSNGGGSGRVRVGGQLTNALDGVHLAPNSLDLSVAGGFLTLKNNTTFDAGTANTLANGFELTLGVGQTGVSNVSFALTNGASVHGGVDNATITLGPSGTGARSFANTSGGTAYLGSNQFAPLGVNRSIVSTGVLDNTGGGQFFINPSGTFTNQGSLRVSTGTVTVAPAGLFTNTGSVDLLAGATLDLAGPVNSAGLGVINRATPTTGTLTLSSSLTLTGNYDLANAGTVRLFGGVVTSGAGGPYTLSSGNAARLQITTHIQNRLDNVNLVAGTLDTGTAIGIVTLSNNVTFGPGSAYSLANYFELVLGPGQTGLGNVALTLTTSAAVYGKVDNAAVTLGPTGTAAAGVNGTGVYAYLGADSGGTPAGVNRSVVNAGLIDNTGSGTLQIIPTGAFTNQGTVRATTGAVTIRPGGAFTNAGTIDLQPVGTVNLDGHFTTAGLGTITRATPSTGTLNLGGVLTLAGNYDLANTGVLRLLGGTVTSGGGGPFILSSTNAARLLVSPAVGNTLSNVNLAAGALDLGTASGFLNLTNATSFAAGSAYVLGSSFELVLGAGQNSLTNLALTLAVSAGVHGGTDNATITLGPSGTAAASLTYAAGGPAYLGGPGGVPLGVNRSITNTGVIDNTGGGAIVVVPSGSFTNQGTVRATAGSVVIGPAASFTNAAGGLLQTTGGTISVTPATMTNDGAIQVGAGTTFSVANGAGTIANDGAVVVNGTLQANLTTNSGGTVAGGGTVTGALTVHVGGHLSPGTSPGTLSVGGGLTLEGTYHWDLTANTTSGPGVNYDRVVVLAGNTSVAPQARLEILLGPSVDLTNAFWQAPHDWTVVDNPGAGTADSAFGPGQILNDVYPQGVFTSFLTGNDVTLHWQPVPEPATVVPVGVFMVLVIAVREIRTTAVGRRRE